MQKEQKTNNLDDILKDVSEEEIKLLKKLEQEGLSTTDIYRILKAAKNGNPYVKNDYKLGRNNIKFGLFGDTHIGNMHYDKDLMKYAAKQFKNRKVDFVAHTGDVLDGWYQNRPQSLFEQNAIGFDQQLNMALEELKQLDNPIYFITGNHEWNTYMRGAGIELGPYLEDRLSDSGLEAKFLGNAEGNIYLNSGTHLQLLHPDGGTAYAISYKSQKIIESIEGGHKPNLLAIGHFHKAEYLFYRNIHAFQTGTLCGQTKYMKGKSIAAHKGFWIVELNTDKDGNIKRIKPEFFPAYH